MARITEFSGVEQPKAVTYGPIRQDGSIDGILISISGAGQTLHLQLQNGDLRYTGIETDRETARQVARHLYEPIRLHGSGRWIREEDGGWTLKHFRVASFDELKGYDLARALAELRGAKGSAWAELDDPIAALEELRNGQNSCKNGRS